MLRHLALFLCLPAAGCSALLPSERESTASPWASYREAQLTFDKIIPGQTMEQDLGSFHLDPGANPNIVILNYSDVLNRFIPHASISMADLDTAVAECLRAKTVCKGYEVKQKHVYRRREGDVVNDLLGFHRETEITGWSFSGLILIRKGVVVYKLTGGQPSIREREEKTNPLGPVQKLIAF
jgi:hypothetical protein